MCLNITVWVGSGMAHSYKCAHGIVPYGIKYVPSHRWNNTLCVLMFCMMFHVTHVVLHTHPN